MARYLLRTQAEILSEVETSMRDSANSRWTDAEIYHCLNKALRMWAGRVFCPHIYTVTGGFSSNTYDYTLPHYVRGNIEPQVLVYDPDISIPVADQANYQWRTLGAYEIVPNSDDGLTLRLFHSVDADARIIWQAENGPVPTTILGLSSGITATDTSLTVNAAVEVNDAGFVKIGSEWIAYAGIARGSSTTTLSGLTRGVYETTAAIANTSASVTWGVGVQRRDLYQQLLDQIMAYLHELFLTDAGARERDVHFGLASTYQGRADAYWRLYTPRAPRLMLGPVLS